MKTLKQFAKIFHFSIGVIGVVFAMYLLEKSDYKLAALSIIISCSIIINDLKYWNKINE